MFIDAKRRSVATLRQEGHVKGEAEHQETHCPLAEGGNVSPSVYKHRPPDGGRMSLRFRGIVVICRLDSLRYPES